MVDDIGLLMGTGTGYGLMVDNNFEKGISTVSDTFCNEPLSFKKNFYIDLIEIYSLSGNY